VLWLSPPWKVWEWMQLCCRVLLLLLCLATSAQAIPIPLCDPCQPSCQSGGDDGHKDGSVVCKDSVLEIFLIYKKAMLILYSGGVPLTVCLLVAWNFLRVNSNSGYWRWRWHRLTSRNSVSGQQPFQLPGRNTEEVSPSRTPQ
jgi:hypothetical protein